MDALLEPRARVATLWPRSVGKTYAYLCACIILAQEKELADIAYIGKTYPQIEETAWKLLTSILDSQYIDYSQNLVKLSITLNNKSKIRLFAADKKDSMDNFRGPRYDLVVVEEAGHWAQDLYMFVNEIIIPTTFGREGRVGLVGTPYYKQQGLFYDITRDKSSLSSWKVFKSSSPYINPHTEIDVRNEIENLKKVHGEDYQNLSQYRREFLAEWVQLDQHRVYLCSEKNLIVELPHECNEFIAGIDFGYNDDTAITVAGYNQRISPTLFILEAIKLKQATSETIVKYIREIEKKYPGVVMVGDYASKQFVVDIQHRYGVNILPAQKIDKYQAICLMNEDFSSGAIKLLPEALPLFEEYSNLSFQAKNGELIKDTRGYPKEDPSEDNHCCDATLYLHRYAYHYLHNTDNSPPRFSDEWFREKEDRAMQKAERELSQEWRHF